MRRAAVWFIPLVLLTLAGCGGGDARLHKEVPAGAEDFAGRFLGSLARGDIPAARAMVDSGVDSALALRGVHGMAAVLHGRKPDSYRLTAVHVARDSGVVRSDLTYELSYPDGWILTMVTVRDSSGHRSVATGWAHAISTAEAAQSRFTLRGKRWSAYLFLLEMLLVAAFCALTAWQVARSRVTFKWFWFLVSLIGVGALEINWGTGATSWTWLWFEFLGVAFSHAAPYTPWTLVVGFPLGALLAQVRLGAARRRQRSDREREGTPAGAA